MSQAYSDIHINTNLGGANFRERGYVHFKQIRLKKVQQDIQLDVSNGQLKIEFVTKERVCLLK